jgi:hypothetical protein
MYCLLPILSCASSTVAAVDNAQVCLAVLWLELTPAGSQEEQARAGAYVTNRQQRTKLHPVQFLLGCKSIILKLCERNTPAARVALKQFQDDALASLEHALICPPGQLPRAA